MPWAVLFFPPYIMQFTNFETSVLWYMGSDTISRFTMCAFLGIEKPQTTANIRLRNSRSEIPINSWIFRIPTARTCAGLSGTNYLSLRPLRAIFRARLLPICNTCGIQRPTNNVITNAGQVLHTAATDQDDGVFLQIVADTGDVGCYFNPIGQTHTCNCAKGRIRLLWRRRIHA